MKYLILIITLFSSNLLYSQDAIPDEFEIFFMNIDYRDSINADFKNDKFDSTIAILEFSSDSSSSFVSIKGNFSNWKSKKWIILGKIQKRKYGDFNQLIMTGIDPILKEIVIISFIVGPFEFPDEIYLPKDELKFEATILYKKKRYIFIGLF